MSGTVAECRTHFQAEPPWSPSRETWSNLGPVMPSHSTGCPFTPTSLALYRGIYLPSPPLGGNSIWNFTSPLFLFLSPTLVSSSRDGWAPRSGVSQPVHHALRLGIKNCKPFTIASHIFLQHPHPKSSPQPRLSPNHTCHNIAIKESLTVTIRTTFPRSPTCDPQPRYSKHLHSSKWGVKKHNLFCTSQIIYFFFLSLLQEFSISL